MTAKNALAIASDHAGYALKEYLKKELPDIEWKDLGPESTERVDYPDFAKKLAKIVGSGQTSAGVLVCGTGVGMSIAANKIKGVRAAVVFSGGVTSTIAARPAPLARMTGKGCAG